MLYDDKLYYEIISDEKFKDIKEDAPFNKGIIKKLIMLYVADSNAQIHIFKKDKNKDEIKNIDLTKYKVLTKYYITKVNGIFACDLEDDYAISLEKIGNFLVSKNDYIVKESNEKVKNMFKEYDSNYIENNEINDDEFINNI